VSPPYRLLADAELAAALVHDGGGACVVRVAPDDRHEVASE
jgi:hypothetical protein